MASARGVCGRRGGGHAGGTGKSTGPSSANSRNSDFLDKMYWRNCRYSVVVSFLAITRASKSSNNDIIGSEKFSGFHFPARTSATICFLIQKLCGSLSHGGAAVNDPN